MIKTDIIIIGAGPVGLFAIFECGMLNMKCHVIDALEHIGGQCQALYPEKPIYDIPGHPKINAGELIEQLTAQAEPFNPVYHMNQTANELTENTDKSWTVKTSADTEINAKAIIIAGGAGAFGANKPPLENIEDFEGTSVFYMVGKRDLFKDKRIVIAGGGDSAVDWANSLSEIAEHIYFVHRRHKFRAAPDSVSKLESLAEKGKVEFIIPGHVSKLSGEGGFLSMITVDDLDRNSQELKADCFLPFFGLAAHLGPLENWGLDIDMHHIKTDPTTAQTNKEGVFAIGDLATYPNKLKLILTGFSEAAMAAHAAYPLVFEGKELHFEYSTSIGVPA